MTATVIIYPPFCAVLAGALEGSATRCVLQRPPHDGLTGTRCAERAGPGGWGRVSPEGPALPHALPAVNRYLRAAA